MNLKELWLRDKDAIKEAQADQAIEELMSDANTYLANKRKEYNAAKKEFQETLENSRDTANFSSLVSASLKLEGIEVEFNAAQELYGELFEGDPIVKSLGSDVKKGK